ncbi:TPA: hypothetical protein ACN380_000002 [Vibrio parahaemolyticus]
MNEYSVVHTEDELEKVIDENTKNIFVANKELLTKAYDAEVYWALDDKPVRKNSMRFQVMKTWLKKSVRASA